MEDKNDDDDKDFCDPSLEEIRIRCQAIRSGWSKSKERNRKVFQDENLVVREISLRDISLE